MSVPEFDQLKAPALGLFGDGRPRKLLELEAALADHFALSEADREERLPSGTERRLHNRVSWACYDLFRAGLLARVARGAYQITDEGRSVSASSPPVIDRAYLMRFPAFAEWIERTSGGKSRQTAASSSSVEPVDQTPLELMEDAAQTLRDTLSAELRELLLSMDPYRFEQVVVDLLVAMGYGGSRAEAARVTKASNDEGIDGVINEDRLGLDVIYVQAKRWRNKVGRKEIQSFVGALAGKQAHKGIFITTGAFSETADAYAKTVQQKIILIDGDRLASLMIEHGVGVSVETSYVIKRVDSDYFED